MNTPVNFEVAKLLKEKGFKMSIRPIFYKHTKSLEQGSYMYDNKGELVLVSMPDIALDKEYVDCPTIAEVIMWLYEKHGIWVSIHTKEGIDLFYYEIRSIKIWFFGVNVNTPTEACEAAIDYTLRYLIK